MSVMDGGPELYLIKTILDSGPELYLIKNVIDQIGNFVCPISI